MIKTASLIAPSPRLVAATTLVFAAAHALGRSCVSSAVPREPLGIVDRAAYEATAAPPEPLPEPPTTTPATPASPPQPQSPGADVAFSFRLECALCAAGLGRVAMVAATSTVTFPNAPSFGALPTLDATVAVTILAGDVVDADPTSTPTPTPAPARRARRAPPRRNERAAHARELHRVEAP
jgi:hypothetical protein